MSSALHALHRLACFLLAPGLAACTAIMPATPAAPSLPAPQAITIVTPRAQRTLTLQDADFAAIADALPALFASVTAQARTVFPPDRFAAEIAPLPHIILRYTDDTDFSGTGIAWRAAELTIAAPGNEIMLLARASSVEDWSVYVPDDPRPLRTFLISLTEP